MKQGQTIRRIAAFALIGLCAASWAALGLTILFDAPRALMISAVIAAAFSTEAMIWGGGALLGWTAFANRARLWRKLTGSV
ncbi:hypothetical protein [Oceanicaulis sp. UBA2681]|uniref:hypothetical protein n=1 Tax=Oceanicaulis sp. UBA2681 TaxID=1947007 RepID=UPI00257D17FF|nr:hypothetical protein [Oceanicaulis sp. UBA2681]